MPSKSNKNKLSLPTYPPPVETVCIPVNVPNDDRWIALFLGAIYRLTQQVWYDRDEAHTAKLVAAVWGDIYLQTVKATWDCDGSMFDLRVSPTDDCLVEKTTDGVVWTEAFRLDTDCALTKIIRNPATGEYGWEVEDVGFYKFPDGPYVAPTSISYPPLPPANGASDNDKRCNAAYGAALALQALYRQTWDEFTRWATEGALLIAEEMMELAESLFRALGGIDIFAEIAQDLYAQSAAFVEGGFPDSELENVTQILYCRSAVSDGVVTIDYADVIADFGAESGSPYAGLNFLLQLYLGQEGLNAAAGVKASSPYNCSAEFYCSDYPEQPYEPYITEGGSLTYLGNNWYRGTATLYTGNYKLRWAYRTKGTSTRVRGRIYDFRFVSGPYTYATSNAFLEWTNGPCGSASNSANVALSTLESAPFPWVNHAGLGRFDRPQVFSVEFQLGPCEYP